MESVYNDIFKIQHTPEEGAWMEERLSVLSAKESIILAALLKCDPPKTAKDAVNMLLNLQTYTVLPASNYNELGELYLTEAGYSLPDILREYTDFAALGAAFEVKHPGTFIRDFYVEFEDPNRKYYYFGQRDLSEFRYMDASIRVKLASVSVPDGVWLRTPIYAEDYTERGCEASIAFRELHVQSLGECTAVDARCTFSAAGNLLEQYDRVEDLIRDANDFGEIVDSNTVSASRLLAAFEYEGCQTLRDMLEVVQNMQRYDFIEGKILKYHAERVLEKLHVPENLMKAGAFDLEGFADAWFRQQGYQPDSTGQIYIRPNENYPRQAQHAPAGPELQM